MAGFPAGLLAEMLRLGLVAEILFAVFGHEPRAADLTGVRQYIRFDREELTNSAPFTAMCRQFVAAGLTDLT